MANKLVIMVQSILFASLIMFIQVLCEEKKETAVYGTLGQAIDLPCPLAVAKPAVIEWLDYVYNTDHNPQLIFSSTGGAEMSHPNAASYRVNNQNMTLTILNLSSEDSGQYICRSTVNTSVVDSFSYDLSVAGKPQCSGNTNVNVNDDLVLSCDLSYAGNTVPVLSWSHDLPDSSGNQPVVSEDQNEIRHARRVLHFKATPDDDGRTYTCHGTFGNDGAEQLCGRTLHVTYGVQNVTFDPVKSVYGVNDVIICKARGQPKPSVVITQPVGVDSDRLQIPKEWAGTQTTVSCTASNSINGQKMIGQAQILLNVTYELPKTTEQTVSIRPTNTSSTVAAAGAAAASSNSSALIIGLIVSALVLALVIVAFICMRKRKHSKKPKGAVAVPTSETTA
jgi:hypothetical protein